jgi:hypothetical protein
MKISRVTKPDLCGPRQSGSDEVAAALATLLPSSARAIALAMHERAAWGYDRALDAHWAEVLRLVSLATRRPSPVSSRSHDANDAAAAAGRSNRRRDLWPISSTGQASAEL